MPPRIARSNVQTNATKNARNKNRKRTLDAYSIASHSTQERNRIPKHRLGEVLDDEPKSKRRRVDSDDEEGLDEDDEEEAEQKRKARKRNVVGGGDDGIEEGSDSEGNEWKLGGLAEDDEDSDLDSDEAFGESDEEKFEGFTFRGSSSGARKKPPKRRLQPQDVDEDDIDLDEVEIGNNDEEDDDSLGDEAVDLATMLDDDDEQEDHVANKRRPVAEDSNGDSESGDDDEESEEESLDLSADEDGDDGDDEERIARLRDRIDAMDTSKGATKSQVTPDESNVLSVEDLLADVDPSTRKQFTAPKVKKSATSKTLATPLPKRQQDRIDRQAATQKAKEQLDRWRDTVIHNRRAEFLSFPLKDPNQAEPIGKDRFVSLADGKEKPQTELEENIQRIMQESGMVSKPGEKPVDEESDFLKAEELATNKLPVEEVLRRRAELRKTRELLFREEIKAKRVAKIKSRSYRRVHRKERERLAEKERALLDPEGLGLDMNEDDREIADRKRAEARMGTKHRDSKWAKSLKATNRTAWDESARDGVLEQARRQEELRRRVAGEDVGDEDGSDASSVLEDSDDDGEGDQDTQTLRRLDRLQSSQHGTIDKGVGSMKFMRDADERKRLRTDEDVERLRKELAVGDGDEEEDVEGEDGGLGRALFGPKSSKGQEVTPAKSRRGELEEGDASDADEAAPSLGNRVTSTQQNGAPLKGILKKKEAASGPLAKGLPPDRRNPDLRAEVQEDAAVSSWLTDVGATKSKRDRKMERSADDSAVLTMTGLDSTAKPMAMMPKQTKAVENGPTTNGTDAGKIAFGWTTVPFKHDDANDSDASDASPEHTLLTPAEQKADFHRRAFAGDDVALAFAAEKAADAEAEDEQEVSTHLPGWGSWTGSGLSKSIKKANARARHNPLYKTKLPGGVKAEDRKDRGKDKVIVSEKTDRKGKKYMAPVLPHEFERKDQYERSLRVPMGPEWTTKEVFQRNTRPRVVVKQGIVAPMERPVV